MAFVRWNIFSQLNRIERMLTNISIQLTKQGNQTMALADDVDSLIEAVEERKTVGDSVMALLTELNDMLKSQVTDPAAQQKLQQAIDALKSKNAEVAAAITKNTPQAQTQQR